MSGVLITIYDRAAPGNGYCATKKVGPLSALQRLAIVLQQAGAEPLVVVAKHPSDEIERHLDEVGVSCLCYGSLQPATACLQAACSHVLLADGSVPLVSVDTARALLQSGKAPAVPLCGGSPGWPVLVPADMLPALGNASFAKTWTDLPARLLACGGAVSVADEGILLRLDRETDWETLMDEYRYVQFRPVSKLMIAREDIFFGPGIHQLLCTLRNAASVRDACGKMGISYSKGWRMIRNLEYQVGFEVVFRHKGGQAGGYSRLSPRGEQLLADYDAYVKACEAAIRPIFERYFGHGPG